MHVRPLSNNLRFTATILLIFLTAIVSAAANDSKTNGPTPTPPKTASIPFNVDFAASSGNSIIVEHDGKRYEIDTAAKTVRELPIGSSSSSETRQSDQQNNAAAAGQSQTAPVQADKYFLPGDDRLLTLPSGQRITKGAVWVNFTHRFPLSPAFSGTALGSTLLGMDDFGIPSFGFQFGVTNRLSLAIYRSPSLIGRPIEMRAALRFLDEHDGQPFNATFRFSIDGQNDFQRNFTTNFELIASRSITRHAQLTLVPTVSIHNRPALNLFNVIQRPPLEQPCSQALASGVPASMHVKPCVNTMSLGVGLSVDIRPTVALIAEVEPMLANAHDIGAHRPPFGFGIQKKILRHSFTFGFTTAPGTTVSQRSQTRAIFNRDPTADRGKGLSVGFNLSRELR